MLKCENVQPQLSAYVDREMPLWTIQLIQWHLKRCPSCARETMRLRQTNKILHQLDPVKTSDNFLPDLMRRAAAITVIEKERVSAVRRILRRLESSFAWMLYSFRTRGRPYAVVTSLAVLATVVSITLYQPRLTLLSNDTVTLAQAPTDKQALLVEFEIVSINQFPKPHLSSNRRTSPLTPVDPHQAR
ncbi:hypothetical protein C6502_12040 [Candidatus Poribacteria bacterium]|nr:MAG: hypothetical protein C6502_12040 [Candidatus Poribacteria bacterium]